MELRTRLARACLAFALVSCQVSVAHAQGSIVVANRASGDISVIAADTDTLTAQVRLPAAPATPEPMYVVQTDDGRLWVGDRANSRVLVYDSVSLSVLGAVPTGQGLFHMAADRHQLWVVNDVDHTATVIDTESLVVLSTVRMPADLSAQGATPHDVVLDRLGSAYITWNGVPGEHDVVVRFRACDFQVTGRAAVGKSPHVEFAHDRLWLPCQGSDAVFVLDGRTLLPLGEVPLPNAHGATSSVDGRRFYTTNIADGGSAGLWTLDTVAKTTVGTPANTPFATPHNLAVTPDGRKLYVTHSGATADKVTVYTLDREGATPALKTEVTVGLNPFGIAYVR